MTCLRGAMVLAAGAALVAGCGSSGSSDKDAAARGGDAAKGVGGGDTGPGAGGDTGPGSGGDTGSETGVTAAPTNLQYSSNPALYALNQPITANQPTSAGGAVTAYAVDAALSAGLTLDLATGVITGTPTLLLARKDFVITASNGAGKTTVTLSLAVADRPSLGYAGAVGSFGSAMTVTPTALADNNSPVTACEIKAGTPALPAGLSIAATTCVISGTPTVVAAAASYTVVATNAIGKSADATVSIEIKATAPVLSYNNAGGTSGQQGTAMTITPTTLSNGGSPVTGCMTTPPLPPGLAINPMTCVISGTPTAPVPTAPFVVNATNAIGTSANAAVALTVTGSPTLSYAGAAGTTGVVNGPMSVTPTVLADHGSPITACAIKGGTTALPAGLTVDNLTCVISGAPTVGVSGGNYVLVATNAVGVSADAMVTLTIRAAAPSLGYAAGGTGTVGVAMAVPATLAANGGGALISCGVKAGTAALPAGLVVSPSTCDISGTPVDSAPTTVYVIVAANAAGSSLDAFVSLTVNPGAPALSFADATLTAGTPASLLPTLSLNGGALTGCGIKVGTPALPAGLSIDPSTCVIAGTPTSGAPPTSYSVVATNAGGSSIPATFSIAINVGVPVLSYAGAANTAGVVGIAMNVVPTRLQTNGAAITGCAFQGAAPPAWVAIDPLTCVVSGTPTAVLAATTYSVAASNSAGASLAAGLKLAAAATPAAPDLSYSGASGTTGRVGVAMTVSPTTFEANGSAITGCAFSGTPSPPAWARVSSSTCVVSGTPTSTLTATAYSVTVTNAQGSATTSVTLEVIDVPTLVYPAAATASVNAPLTITPSMRSSNGSAITACGIKAGTTPLPTTLSVNPTTCVISGTPTSTLPATLFTLVAKNAAGASADATVTVTINAAPPTLSYQGAAGTTGAVGVFMTITPTTFSSNGAAVTSCLAAPTLPAGLAVNPTTCVISGTPAQAVVATSYTVTATSAAGDSVGAAVSVTVTASAPTLSYAGATGTAGTYGAPMTVSPTTLLGNGSAISACGVKVPNSPLPGGLAVNATTCVISGTPTEAASGTYTLVATNGAGDSADATVQLTINALPPALVYGPASVLKVGRAAAVAPVTFSTNGAPLSSCSISPALPPPLTISSATCVISGTPSATLPSTTYSVVAKNSGGSTSATVTLQINDVPLLGYAGATGTAGIRGVPMTIAPTTLSANGSPITACSSSPALPAGLVIDATTCVISGTPSGTAATASYRITAVNGAGDGVATVSIVVRSPASLAISDSPTFNFGSWGTSNSMDHVFFVTNNGQLPATGVAAAGPIGTAFSFKGGAFPGFGGDCGATLSAGWTCRLVVTFTPPNAASFSGTVALGYQDGVKGQTVSVGVTGTGTAGAALAITDWPPVYYSTFGLAPDGPVHDFGLLGVGVTVFHTFTVTNNGAGPATITGGTIDTGTTTAFSWKGGTFPGAGGSCGIAPLAPEGQCTVSVTVTAPLGMATSGITINYTGGSSGGVTRNLAVTGTTGAAVQIFDFQTDTGGVNLGPKWDFGTIGVGATTSHEFVVMNSGGAAATGVSATLPTAFRFPGGFPGGPAGARAQAGDNLTYCTTTLPAVSRCVVRIEFAPVEAIGYAGDASLSYNAGMTAVRAVKGAGTAYALLAIQDDSDKGGFGIVSSYGVQPIGGTASQVYLVRNVGGAPAQNLAPAALGAGFAFSGGTFPGGSGTYTNRNGQSYPYCAGALLTSLPPGGVCAARVDFAPTMVKAYATKLGIGYQDGSGTSASVTLALEGEGTDLAIVSLECSACRDRDILVADVGTQPTGGGAPVAVLLTNRGGRAAILTDGGTLSPPFEYFTGSFPGGSGTVEYNRSIYNFCGPAPYSLAPGATCIIGVVYRAPATPGVHTGLLTVNTGSSTTATVSLPFTGASTNLAIVTMTDCVNCGGGGGGGGGGTPTHDFGFVASPGMASVFFVVSNTGASAATLANGGFSGSGFGWSGGTYPGGSGTVNMNGRTYSFCGASLVAGGTCVVQVSYTASGLTPQAGSFAINLGGATTPSVAYNLTASPTNKAVVSLSECESCGGGGGGPNGGPPTYDFGTVRKNSQVTKYFYLRNSGATAATISGESVTGSGFGWTGNAFPGGSPGSPVPDVFKGGGPPLNFCPALGGLVAPNTTCVLQVTYSVQGLAQQSGNITIAVGNATVNSVSYNLMGQPTDLAIVRVTDCAGCGGGGGGPNGGPPTHFFGTVAAGQSVVGYFFISNDGNGTATLSANPLTGDKAFSWNSPGFTGTGFPGANQGSINTGWGPYPVCPPSGGNLAAGATCVAVITYAASGSSTQNGAFSIALGGASTPGLAYNLSGTSTTAAIMSLRDCSNCGGGGGGGNGGPPPRHDFGTVPSPGAYVAWFFLQNTGASAGTVTGAAVGGNEFSFNSPGFGGSGFPGAAAGTVQLDNTMFTVCSAPVTSLASGATCVFAVTYSATGTAPQGGSLMLSLSGATVPSLSFDLTGQPTTAAIITVRDCDNCGGGGKFDPPFDFGTAGTTIERFFVVSNTGASTGGLFDGTGWNAGSLFGYSGASYPGGSGNVTIFGRDYAYCGSTLAPSSVCVLSVRYLGTATGSGTLMLNLTGATASTASRTLTGTATNRALLTLGDEATWFPCSDNSCGGNPADFGNVAINSQSPYNVFVVANRGALGASLTPNALGLPFWFGTTTAVAFPGGSGTTVARDGTTVPFCSSSLAPGAKCAVAAYFRPTAGGSFFGAIDVSYDDSLGPIAVHARRALTGRAP